MEYFPQNIGLIYTIGPKKDIKSYIATDLIHGELAIISLFIANDLQLYN